MVCLCSQSRSALEASHNLRPCQSCRQGECQVHVVTVLLVVPYLVAWGEEVEEDQKVVYRSRTFFLPFGQESVENQFAC